MLQFLFKLLKRDKVKVACLEEIAWSKGWLSDDELREKGNLMAKNEYGQYLLQLLKSQNR